MACQSLDNDEILNVRWATEDPNPVQKVAEKRRLEDQGKDAIRARMDPKVVDAMRAVRALEDGDVLIEREDGLMVQEEEMEVGEEHEAKRQKLAIEDAPQPEEPSKTQGLLSADAMEGLKYFAEIRKRNTASPAALKPPAKAKPTLVLADYGSDEE